MASKAGQSAMFLDPEERERLKSEVAAAKLDFAKMKENQAGTGCLTCGLDNDHANMLLCELCNGEYHTYCLNPPLKGVPEGEWYCDNCKHEGDGLEELVASLPPAVTSRFGEIVWAQGGPGFGWWPCCIYDPRLTVGSARQQGRKTLGKKFLVYFFECHAEPFSCLLSNKIQTWEEGLAEDYHLGRAAKSSGKRRLLQFQQAFQAAIIEESKPIEKRLDWNHTSPTKTVLAEKKLIGNKSPKKRPRNGDTESNTGDNKKSRADREAASMNAQTNKVPQQVAVPNKQPASGRVLHVVEPKGSSSLPVVTVEAPWNSSPVRRIDASSRELVPVAPYPGQTAAHPRTGYFYPYHSGAYPHPYAGYAHHPGHPPAPPPPPPPVDRGLFCKVKKQDSNDKTETSIGFINLPSRHTSTFADCRTMIESELDLPDGSDWRFLLPNLGPVSKKQEAKFGAILPFLEASGVEINDGSMKNPVKIVIVDAPVL